MVARSSPAATRPCDATISIENWRCCSVATGTLFYKQEGRRDRLVAAEKGAEGVDQNALMEADQSTRSFDGPQIGARRATRAAAKGVRGPRSTATAGRLGRARLGLASCFVRIMSRRPPQRLEVKT